MGLSTKEFFIFFGAYGYGLLTVLAVLLMINCKEDEMKKQGFNAKLDESMGERNKGKKKQSMKSRRDESKGMEKAKGKRAYSAVTSMDKPKSKKK